jgi:hypothetical protein
MERILVLGGDDLVAANPRDPKNLIGTAIVGDLDAIDARPTPHLTAAIPGGKNTFSDIPETGSGGPQVARKWMWESNN